MHISYPPVRATYRPHPTVLDNPNNFRWEVQVTTFLCMQLPPVLYFFVPFLPKYLLSLTRVNLIWKLIIQVSQEERSIFCEVILSVILNKKKVYMYMWPIPNGFRGTAISLHRWKIVDKKEILRIVSNIGIYCSSDKDGTVYLLHFRKFYRQHQRTLQLVWGHGVLLVLVPLDVPLCGR